MPSNTWLKRTLWAGALIGSAALMPACQHPRYEERGVGGAGYESRQRGDQPNWDRDTGRVLDQDSSQRGVDTTRDSPIFSPPLHEDPNAIQGGGVGGAGTVGNDDQIDRRGPYGRSPDAYKDELQQKREKANPNASQHRQPYIDPYENSQNPASVGGAAGGGAGGGGGGGM